MILKGHAISDLPIEQPDWFLLDMKCQTGKGALPRRATGMVRAKVGARTDATMSGVGPDPMTAVSCYFFAGNGVAMNPWSLPKASNHIPTMSPVSVMPCGSVLIPPGNASNLKRERVIAS